MHDYRYGCAANEICKGVELSSLTFPCMNREGVALLSSKHIKDLNKHGSCEKAPPLCEWCGAKSHTLRIAKSNALKMHRCIATVQRISDPNPLSTVCSRQHKKSRKMLLTFIDAGSCLLAMLDDTKQKVKAPIGPQSVM